MKRIKTISDRLLIIIEIKIFIIIIFLLISIKSFHKIKPFKEINNEQNLNLQNYTRNKTNEKQLKIIKGNFTNNYTQNQIIGKTLEIKSENKKKKVGVITNPHDDNIDNNLFKYAMFITLKELGIDPYIIGYIKPNIKFSFLNKTTNLINIKKTFKEINKNEYDIFIINNIKAFKNEYKNFLYTDIPKFFYGSQPDFIDSILVGGKKEIAKIKKYLNYEPNLVLLDPTMLIDNKYYKNIIKDYKSEFKPNDNYIFIYRKVRDKYLDIFINKVKKKLNYKVYNCYVNDSVQKFIYGIINCKSVITSSYYGVIFSLIFNKPFVFFQKTKMENRKIFSVLNNIEIYKRIFKNYKKLNISLLTIPPNINHTLIDELKNLNIKYLKKNLNIM